MFRWGLYSLRNLWARRVTTALTVVGLGLVVSMTPGENVWNLGFALLAPLADAEPPPPRIAVDPDCPTPPRTEVRSGLPDIVRA